MPLEKKRQIKNSKHEKKKKIESKLKFDQKSYSNPWQGQLIKIEWDIPR